MTFQPLGNRVLIGKKKKEPNQDLPTWVINKSPRITCHKEGSPP